ncbi:hypothetical protein FSP39_019378 [Pinctada imbricata]|uniref:Beta-lactamase-related domain-containing protein n=1 Tax=Pinctada imbricata TaxID=66713 RepID=A0AA89BW59_PINIB|nr:hypothetical protein FSP39_019378 [Pinctada imbricata]
MAVSVVKDGRILMAKGYGYLDTSKRSPVTNRTLFQISSLTKAFASTLLLKQMKENTNFSLYSKLTDVIGNDFKFSEDLWTQNADLKDLMSMNLAIPRHDGLRLTKSVTRENLLSLMRHFKPIYVFRSTFLYSNLNYGIVTRISEKLAGGEQWENLIRREIFDPVGMSSSTFTTSNTKEIETTIAKGYVVENNRLVEVPAEFRSTYSMICGSNCIMSNTEDISKWMMLQLNKGFNEQGKPVIDSDIVQLTHRPWTLIKAPKLSSLFSQPVVPVSTTEFSYGLGWKNGNYRDESTICTFPRPFHADPMEWISLKVDKSQESTRPLPQYEGVYSHDAYGKLSVTYNVTSRRLNIEFGIGKWTLFPTSTPNMFYGLAMGILQGIWNLNNIQFDSTCDKCSINSVAIGSFEKKAPPIFKRVHVDSFPACPNYRK